MGNFLKNIGTRFISLPLIGSALFLMTQSCSPTKAITYSSQPDPDPAKTQVDKHNDSINSAHYRQNHFYKYNDSLNWTPGKQTYAYDIAYRHGKIREHAIFPNEQIKNPTKEQEYLQNITDIIEKSSVGKDIVATAEQENVVVYADTTDISNGGYYKDKRISNTLIGFDDSFQRLREEGTLKSNITKEMVEAFHTLTLFEEYIHAKDFITNGVSVDDTSQVKLTPLSILERQYSFEAAAKTNVIIGMHELKQQGYESLWKNAQKVEEVRDSNVMSHMMQYYDGKVSENSTQQEKLDAASYVYKTILHDPQFRSEYFKYGYKNIKHDTDNTFREITRDEIKRAGNIPDTQVNFIENAYKIGILNDSLIYSPFQKEALEKKQKEIQEANPNFTPTRFTETDLGGFIPVAPVSKKVSSPTIKN